MKKILLFFFLSYSSIMQAQISEGSIAPNFTFNDLNGNPQHLYSYLNANKFVFIELSATWCSPCWYLHDSIHLLNQVYNAYDNPGDQTGKVFFIEADVNTSLADLQGTGTNTLGDWISGTNYSIMSPSSNPQSGETSFSTFQSNYLIAGLPLMMVVCPNKRVWFDTLNNPNKTTPWPPSVSTIQWIANTKCNLPSAVDDLQHAQAITLYPNPAMDYATLYFQLQEAQEIALDIISLTGQRLKHLPSQKCQAGDQQVRLDVQALSKGLYYVHLKTNASMFTKRLVVL